MPILEELSRAAMKKKVPHFEVGDTVDVHVKIKEGDRERIQIFNGVVISRQGGLSQETFTVRRIVQGEGVERIFLLHSPLIGDIVIKRKGNPRRAKLYYLRKRSGKSAKIKEKLGEIPGEETASPDTPPKADEASPAEETASSL
ncbi:MAG: 50S ribosomal protein L19 [Planctomycetota bacterium]|mgnify:CR=1 FL=1